MNKCLRALALALVLCLAVPLAQGEGGGTVYFSFRGVLFAWRGTHHLIYVATRWHDEPAGL